MDDDVKDGLAKCWVKLIKRPDAFEYSTEPAHSADLNSDTISSQFRLLFETRKLVTSLNATEAQDHESKVVEAL